jgi:hypothetical protein
MQLAEFPQYSRCSLQYSGDRRDQGAPEQLAILDY